VPKAEILTAVDPHQVADLIHKGFGQEDICTLLDCTVEDIKTKQVKKLVLRRKLQDINRVESLVEDENLNGIHAAGYWMKHIHGWTNTQADELAKRAAQKQRKRMDLEIGLEADDEIKWGKLFEIEKQRTLSIANKQRQLERMTK
jgi:hypothetical protein